MPTALRFLVFDVADDADGVVTLQAMATTRREAHAAVRAEVEAVLGWAAQTFPNGPGALDDGHDWDRDLLVADDGGWVEATLTLAATPAFAEAFAAEFGSGDD